MSIWSGLAGFGRDRHYTRGMVHFNRGEYAEAASELEQAVSRHGDPRDPDRSLSAFYAAEARLHLALACLYAGEWAAAEEHLRRALAANPEYPDLHCHLASVLERRDALEEARTAARAALERNPRYGRAWIVLAVVADRQEDRFECVRALGEARRLGMELPAGLPTDTRRGLTEDERHLLRGVGEALERAQYDLEQGLECSAREDWEGALAAFTRAVEAQPTYPDLRARRASLLGELGRHAEAATEWRQALDLNPNYVEARFRLAVSLLATGRSGEAANEILAVSERLPADPAVRHLSGLILLADGRVREAEAALAGIARRSGQESAQRLLGLCKLLERELEEAERLFHAAAAADVDGAVDLAWMALKRGDAAAAAKALRASLAGDHARFETLYGLGQAARTEGRFEEARAAFTRALDECTPDSVERGLTLFGRGAASFEHGEVERALPDLEEATRRLEGSAEAWLLLGRARRRAGDPTRAEAALRRAVDCYPGWPEALAELADFLTRAGRGGEAADYWERVRRVDPLHPLARAHRGEILRDALHRAYGG